MNSQIIPLLGIISPSFTPEPLRTITVNATFEGEQTSVYKEAVLMDSASSGDVLSYFPLRDGKYSSRSFVASAIDDPDKNRVIMLYGSSPEDQAVVAKSLKITSDLNIMLDLSETGGGIVDYPLLTGIGKLSGFFDLSSLPESVNYSDITIIANYRDPLEGTYNGLQAGKTTCNPDGSWAIEGLNEAHRYNVVMSIPTFNDITYSNKETSDSTYVPEDDPPLLPTEIGEFFQGGYYIGDIKDQGKHYKILVAPKDSEVYGLRWKTNNTATLGTVSSTDGWSNTLAMNSPDHPAAMYCINYLGGGHDDWYMPAKDELNLFWVNISPNNTAVLDFKAGGSQALQVPEYYWSSTQYDQFYSWGQRFGDGIKDNRPKDIVYVITRPVRRLEFTP